MSSPTSAPAAPAPAGGIPFVTDAVRLLRALVSPGKVFEEIRDRPTFWRPFAVVAVISALLGYLQQPFQQRLSTLLLERAGRPVPPVTPVRTIIGLVVGTPLTVLVGCLFIGGLLYVMVMMFGGQTTFKKMLAVAIMAWPVFLIQQAVTFAVLTMRGVGSINGPMDMMVSLGVELLLPADAQISYFLRFLLAGIGPLLIWSMTIRAVGLSVMAGTGKGASWTAAALNQLIGLAILSGLGAATMKLMGG